MSRVQGQWRGRVAAGWVLVMAAIVRRLVWDRLFFLTTEQYAAQLIPFELLRGDPVGSIWNFHCQPPLFNALVACALRVFGDHAVLALRLLMVGLGLGASTLLTLAVQRVTDSAVVALLVGLSVGLLPSALLFESWLFYAQLEFFALALLAWLIARLRGASAADRARSFVQLGALGLALTLIRSAYHPAWLIVLLVGWLATQARIESSTPAAPTTAGGAVHGLRRAARRPLAWATLFSALALAWPAKNAVQFGFFGSSSWLGMSLAKVAVYPLPVAQRAEWVKRGVLSPYAMAAPFLPVDAYQPLPAAPPATHPVLALPLNDLRYIDVSDRLKEDAVWVIRHQPAAYLENVHAAATRFFEPTTLHSAFTARNIPAIEGYELAVRGLLYPGGTLLPAIMLYFVPLVAGVACWLRAVFTRRGPVDTALQGFVIAATLGYAFVVFNFTEFGENNRFRYTLLPLVVLGNAWVGGAAARWLRRRADQRAGRIQS